MLSLDPPLGLVNVPVLRSQIVCSKSTKDNFRLTESLLSNYLRFIARTRKETSK